MHSCFLQAWYKVVISLSQGKTTIFEPLTSNSSRMQQLLPTCDNSIIYMAKKFSWESVQNILPNLKNTENKTQNDTHTKEEKKRNPF